MKRPSFRTAVPLVAAAFAAGLSLAACNGTEVAGAPEEGGLLIRVVDYSGAPLGVDTVTWSYYGDGDASLHKAAHGADSTHKPATRGNAEGSVWTVGNEGLHGAVFVRARYRRVVDSFCTDQGYVVSEVDADSLPQEVTLTMTVATMCL